MAYEATHIRDFGSKYYGNGKTLASGPAWTEEEDAALAKLWSEGLTFGVIAKRLAALPGGRKRSRNACVGRAHRMGLRRPEKTLQNYKPARPRPARQPSPPRVRQVRVVQEPPPILPPIGAVCIVDAAPGTCRFITGDVKGAHRLCGHPGEPWCAAHRALVYGKGQPEGTAPVHVPRRRAGRILANSIGAFGQ